MPIFKGRASIARGLTKIAVATLAALMAGRAWTSTYEWYAHERYARDEGIDAAVIAAIAEHRRPELAAMPAEDAMVWRVTDELLYTRRVTDATYRKALAALGERGLVNLLVLMGHSNIRCAQQALAGADCVL